MCNFDSSFLELGRKDDPFIFKNNVVSRHCELWKDGSKTLNVGRFRLWNPRLSLLDECCYLLQSRVFVGAWLVQLLRYLGNRWLVWCEEGTGDY